MFLSSGPLESLLLYLARQLPLDFVYPGLVAVTYTLLLIWLFKQGFAAKSPNFYLACVAAFAGFFDYLENSRSFQANIPLRVRFQRGGGRCSR